jgi:hypothetical protein
MDRRTFNKLVIATAGLACLPSALDSGLLGTKRYEESYVRIGMNPFIYEDTDRWGMPEGTFSVMSAVGYVDQAHWHALQEFEQYDMRGGKEEMAEAARQLKAGVDMKDIRMPIMKRVIGYSMIKQFNMRLTDPAIDKSDVTEYIRCMARFNEPSLKVWTTADDARLIKLEQQCDEMNRKANG